MPEDTREVAILGSTGSIGTQALDVISRNTGRFDVVALAAGANTRLLAQQVAATGARIAGIASDGGTAENPDQPPLAQALAEAGVHH